MHIIEPTLRCLTEGEDVYIVWGFSEHIEFIKDFPFITFRDFDSLNYFQTLPYLNPTLVHFIFGKVLGHLDVV